MSLWEGPCLLSLLGSNILCGDNDTCQGPWRFQFVKPPALKNVLSLSQTQHLPGRMSAWNLSPSKWNRFSQLCRLVAGRDLRARRRAQHPHPTQEAHVGLTKTQALCMSAHAQEWCSGPGDHAVSPSPPQPSGPPLCGSPARSRGLFSFCSFKEGPLPWDAGMRARPRENHRGIHRCHF